MPVKLIGTILLMVLVAVLTGFNLDNKCDIWFFHTFKDIPIVYSVLTSFVLGVVVTLPAIFIKKNRNNNGSNKSSRSAGKNSSSSMPAHKVDKDGDE